MRRPSSIERGRAGPAGPTPGRRPPPGGRRWSPGSRRAGIPVGEDDVAQVGGRSDASPTPMSTVPIPDETGNPPTSRAAPSRATTTATGTSASRAGLSDRGAVCSSETSWRVDRVGIVMVGTERSAGHHGRPMPALSASSLDPGDDAGQERAHRLGGERRHGPDRTPGSRSAGAAGAPRRRAPGAGRPAGGRHRGGRVAGPPRPGRTARRAGGARRPHPSRDHELRRRGPTAPGGRRLGRRIAGPTRRLGLGARLARHRRVLGGGDRRRRRPDAADVVAQGVLLGLPVAALPAAPSAPGATSPVDGRRIDDTGAGRPLEAAVVVDLTSLWAGPLCGAAARRRRSPRRQGGVRGAARRGPPRPRRVLRPAQRRQGERGHRPRQPRGGGS